MPKGHDHNSRRSTAIPRDARVIKKPKSEEIVPKDPIITSSFAEASPTTAFCLSLLLISGHFAGVQAKITNTPKPLAHNGHWRLPNGELRKVDGMTRDEMLEWLYAPRVSHLSDPSLKEPECQLPEGTWMGSCDLGSASATFEPYESQDPILKDYELCKLEVDCYPDRESHILKHNECVFPANQIYEGVKNKNGSLVDSDGKPFCMPSAPKSDPNMPDSIPEQGVICEASRAPGSYQKGCTPKPPEPYISPDAKVRNTARLCQQELSCDDGTWEKATARLIYWDLKAKEDGRKIENCGGRLAIREKNSRDDQCLRLINMVSDALGRVDPLSRERECRSGDIKCKKEFIATNVGYQGQEVAVFGSPKKKKRTPRADQY